MEVDGSVVQIKPLTPEVEYHYSDGTPVYRQKSLYEVYVDDVMRGYVWFPKGWGGRWHVLALRPKQSYNPNYNRQDAEEKARFGLAGYYRSLSPGSLNEREDWGEHARYFEDRNAILAAFPKMVALGRCPSPAEEIVNAEAAKRAYEEQQAEDARRTGQRAQERAQAERERVAAAARAEEERQETLDGLISIRDRFAGQLSNLEMVALTRAIDRVTK
jgi:hypothetical protein